MADQEIFLNVDLANVSRIEGIGLLVQNGQFEGLKHNLTAADPPEITDDETEGYSKLSHWVTPTEVYICADPSEGAAVWQSGSGVGPEIDCGTF